MRQNFFRGLVAVGCCIAASFGTAAMAAGCTSDDIGSGIVPSVDSGSTIIRDGGSKQDATATITAASVVDASVCPSAQTICGGACATLSRDSQNCGACGNVCAAGEACSAGACTTDCGGGQNLCAPGDAGDAGSAYCANFSSDNANCGACGSHCAAGEVCSAGSCQTTCGASQTECNVGDAGADAGHGGAPFCATLSSDDSNCGACGKACSAGESCQSGVCAVTCAPSETLCSSVDGTTDGTDGGISYCASFATDNANCGGCGTTCGAGQVCSNGTCGTTCEADLLQCGSKCIDPNSSITNCGATAACDSDAGTSGAACPTDYACTSGTCYPLAPTEVGSFNVNSGPQFFPDAPPAYSCAQACTAVFGGPYTYGCSTVDGTLNHLAWGSEYGSGAHCATNDSTLDPGTPVADTFTQGDGNYDYFATGPDGYGSFSAYVEDNCFEGNPSINYCWILPP